MTLGMSQQPFRKEGLSGGDKPRPQNGFFNQLGLYG
jgi:hypothetical protein